MNAILSAGVLIGVLCGLVTFAMGLIEPAQDPVRRQLTFVALVTAIEIGGLIWGLRRTAREGRRYAGQVAAGTRMAMVAAVIVVLSSLVMLTVVAPDYFSRQEAAYREALRQEGRSEPEIAVAVSTNLPETTPMAQAIQGLAGTLVTGVLASAVIAIWVRAKPAA